jgi:nucleotide-binding universal stress UspA family protein
LTCTWKEKAMSSHNESAGKIVVAVDGSPSSVQALRWASHQAQATQAGIEAVIVWAQPVEPGWPRGIPYDWPGNAGLELHQAVVDALGDKAAGDVTETVLEGHPVPTLIAAASDADMLVVGSRGHGALAGVLLGSVSARLCEHSPCPLTIVRPPKHEPAHDVPRERAASPLRAEWDFQFDGRQFWR